MTSYQDEHAPIKFMTGVSLNHLTYGSNAKTGQTTCTRRKYDISAGQHQPSSGLLNEREFTWSLYNEPEITGQGYVMC